MQTTVPSMTAFEQQRMAWCLAMHPVLANGHRGVDEGLRAWAKQTGRLVSIGRPGPWGNDAYPGRITTPAQRARAVEAYRAAFPTKGHLHALLPGVCGKVLVCYCAPEDCHGLVIIAACDPDFIDEYRAVSRAYRHGVGA